MNFNMKLIFYWFGCFIDDLRGNYLLLFFKVKARQKGLPACFDLRRTKMGLFVLRLKSGQ